MTRANANSGGGKFAKHGYKQRQHTLFTHLSGRELDRKMERLAACEIRAFVSSLVHPDLCGCCSTHREPPIFGEVDEQGGCCPVPSGTPSHHLRLFNPNAESILSNKSTDEDNSKR